MTMKLQTDDARRQFGFDGEQFAATYLQGLGWQIVDTNWRCELGEIDLGCLEPSPLGLPRAVVVEVKTRAGLGYGTPLEAITPEKLARLNQLASRWAAQLDLPHAGLRVDGIGIVRRRGCRPTLEHIRGLR